VLLIARSDSAATIDLSVGEDESKRIVICNPELFPPRISAGDEGCLSIPDFCDSVTRPLKIVVQAQDPNGEELKSRRKVFACFQHEIDHLNGILFVDHLSPLKRSLIRNKIKKMTKAGEW
jgi:peptide deformylase